MDDFKSKNITRNEITKLDEKQSDNIDEITKSMIEDAAVYIIRPNTGIMNLIAKNHYLLNAIHPNVKEYIIFIPKENYDIIEYLQTNSMLSQFRLENFNVDLIPIDLDLLSLEKENSIKEIYIDKDYSSISDLANAVVKLETCFGKIIHQYVKGDLAQKFCDLLKDKEKENNLKLGADEILGMVVFDRSVDFLTLMTTNNTCEGLIDETFGINLGKIRVKNNLLSKGLQDKKGPKISDNEVTYALTSNINPFFSLVSCMRHFDAIRYITEVRSYYQNLMAKNKNLARVDEEGQNAIREMGYFINSLKHDLFRV